MDGREGRNGRIWKDETRDGWNKGGRRRMMRKETINEGRKRVEILRKEGRKEGGH